ncbi:hypothetical protein [Streptomyces sp. NPDC001070]
MAESLPLPAEAPSHPDPGALDPTEVIPRAQPVEAGEAAEVKVISGEVVGGRHRGRSRGPGRGSLGTAVLTATGAVAGLSMLMPHGGSGSAVAEAAQEPASIVPDGVVKDAVAPPVAGATASAHTGEAATTAAARKPTADTSTGAGVRNAAQTGTPGTSASAGRHARISGSWDSEDWQEAVARAVAGHRSGAQGHYSGRHRYGGGNGGYGSGQWDGGSPSGDWSWRG